MKISDLSVSGDYGKNGRLKMDEYFGLVTLIISQRSTCLRRHVGALIVDNGHIIATGYNGAPTKMDDCLEKGCLVRGGHCVRAVHAEQNAIIQAARYGINIQGATLYCTHQPCVICAKMIINAGISRVVYKEGYPDEFSMEILNEAGISVEKMPWPPEDTPA